MATLDEIRSAIKTAVEQTDCIEERALSLLRQTGCMEDLTCQEQREVERRVRLICLNVLYKPNHVYREGDLK